MSSTPESPREMTAAEQEQVERWLAQADEAAKSEDWERSIALYRKALEFDRYLQGGEAKLQWALRMRETQRLYDEGKAKLEGGDYEGALVLLRKARAMYASHYKDVDELIVRAQTQLQKQKWDARPPEATRAARGSIRLWLILAVAVVVLLVMGIWFLLLRGGA